MVYEWKFPMPVDAQIAGEELARIEGEHSNLTPELVLEESRNESAVLHPCFEWDDSIAAEKYRLDQAGYLLRNIVITVTKTADAKVDAPEEVKVRAFVNVSEEKKGVYVPIKTALSQENYRKRVLENALAELLMFQNKYSIYVELAGVCKAIEEFAATLDA